jgi:hypothetical protein
MGTQNRNGIVAANAVRRLRLKKLRDGHTFLIYTSDLPSRHGYLEYPEGRIVLVTVKPGEQDFTPIRELTREENTAIRSELNLERVTP